MSNADIRGRFVWHELMTTDPDAAGAFYSNLVPWKTQPSGMPSYTIWMSGKTRAGGLMALPHGDASATPPHWIIYIGTPDVDGTVQAAQRLGGRVLKGAADIPNVGRFAVLSDPQGAAFAVFTPAPGSTEAPSGGGVGEFTWHELATTDLDSALRFYSELFGWSKGSAHDMGAMGIYQLISHGGQDVGGAYKARDASTPPSWLSYVRVGDAAKAAAITKSGGGRVLHGPVEVPGGSWIVMLLDPQGGAFAVVEAPKAAAAKPSQPAKAATPASKPLEAPKPPATKPAAAPAAKPASAPAKPAALGPAAPARSAAAPRTPSVKAAAKKPARKKAAGKAATKSKSAGRRKPRRSAAAKKRPAAKRSAGKRSAGKKSTRAKRGSAVKRSAKAGTRTAARSARGKSRKHR